jgi:hypothetical protein
VDVQIKVFSNNYQIDTFSSILLMKLCCQQHGVSELDNINSVTAARPNYSDVENKNSTSPEE